MAASWNLMEAVMIGKRTLVLLAVVGPLAVVASTPAAASIFGGRHQGGYVIPCSLDGVNPAFHPEIFGSPAAAREYGFVQSRDGAWRVQPNCQRGVTVPY
jgi:hypothetical protein